MAGKLGAEQEKLHHSDILFDLTPEDDKGLLESELLDLINYGQVRKPIKIPGASGREYEADLALLWDEDHIDILKRTTAYANDPLLRVRVIRRLKLHKSIQRIDHYKYDDQEDLVAQRQLWAILCRMSDAQIEYLDAKYHETELERNVQMVQAIRTMTAEFDSEEKKKQKSQTSGNKITPSPVDEHVELMRQAKERQENLAQTVTAMATGGQSAASEPVEGKAAEIKSPKQSLTPND